MRRQSVEHITNIGLANRQQLLTDAAFYKNNKTKLHWRCLDCNKTYYKDWAHFSRKKCCKFCKRLQNGKRLKQTLENVRAEAERRGQQVVSDSYVTAHIPLKWRCLKHDIVYEKTWNGFQQGSDCSICGYLRISSSQRLPVDFVISEANKKGYKMLSSPDSFKNIQTKLLWEHVEFGHTFSMNFGNMQQGKRCSVCARTRRGRALFENAVFLRVQSIFPDAKQNVKGLLPNKRFELDVWVPSLYRAIELDGDYWHSQPESKERDARKNKECKKVGIKLFRLRYSSYVANPEKALCKIVGFLIEESTVFNSYG